MQEIQQKNSPWKKIGAIMIIFKCKCRGVSLKKIKKLAKYYQKLTIFNV